MGPQVHACVTSEVYYAAQFPNITHEPIGVVTLEGDLVKQLLERVAALEKRCAQLEAAVGGP
jgi:hypothetical protein